MGRHSTAHAMDYFETRALELEQKQLRRYEVDPPKDDDLTRHLRELEVTDLIQKFRLISGTYQDEGIS